MTMILTLAAFFAAVLAAGFLAGRFLHAGSDEPAAAPPPDPWAGLPEGGRRGPSRTMWD